MSNIIKFPKFKSVEAGNPQSASSNKVTNITKLSDRVSKPVVEDSKLVQSQETAKAIPITLNVLRTDPHRSAIISPEEKAFFMNLINQQQYQVHVGLLLSWLEQDVSLREGLQSIGVIE
jgi:hypothetical protein